MGPEDPTPVTFAINGPILRSDLPGLSQRVCRVLGRYEGHALLCDASRVTADAVTVDALARLQLAAHRHGCRIRLQGASSELLELLSFMGLDDVLPG
jgi:ABC-type transporter Mla MlaB component